MKPVNIGCVGLHARCTLQTIRHAGHRLLNRTPGKIFSSLGQYSHEAKNQFVPFVFCRLVQIGPEAFHYTKIRTGRGMVKDSIGAIWSKKAVVEPNLCLGSLSWRNTYPPPLTLGNHGEKSGGVRFSRILSMRSALKLLSKWYDFLPSLPSLSFCFPA